MWKWKPIPILASPVQTKLTDLWLILNCTHIWLFTAWISTTNASIPDVVVQLSWGKTRPAESSGTLIKTIRLVLRLYVIFFCFTFRQCATFWEGKLWEKIKVRELCSFWKKLPGKEIQLVRDKLHWRTQQLH